MRTTSIRLVIALLVTGPLLAACASDFDPTDWTDKLDFFHLNDKKKLPGERKEVFPGGVPGAQQGIPADLVKGHQPPVAAEQPQEQQEQQKEKEQAQQEKPKPKPRVAHRPPPKSKPTQVTVSPQQQQSQQLQQPQTVWPDSKPQAQQQTGTQAPWPSAPQQQPSAWPDAPPPNTFQR